jgi:hypothetical protein
MVAISRRKYLGRHAWKACRVPNRYATLHEPRCRCTLSRKAKAT